MIDPEKLLDEGEELLRTFYNIATQQAARIKAMERTERVDTSIAKQLSQSMATNAKLHHRIEALVALLREARQYVADAGCCDEDSETQRNSSYLLIEIDTALEALG